MMSYQARDKHAPLYLLVVEDHPDVASNIYDYLEARGHKPDAALDGETGMRLMSQHDYDVVVLDIMLPDCSGLDFSRRVRNTMRRYTPILMLTAKDTLEDKLDGFDAGADDYLVKPFEMRELEARLTALNRRAEHSGREGPLLEVDDLRFDEQTLHVTRGGRSLDLNPTCRRILALLMRESPKVVSRQRLEAAIWGDHPPASDSLRTHIYMLRRVIDEPFENALLQTVSRAGYRLALTPGASP